MTTWIKTVAPVRDHGVVRRMRVGGDRLARAALRGGAMTFLRGVHSGVSSGSLLSRMTALYLPLLSGVTSFE